jgi:hypothetical protein
MGLVCQLIPAICKRLQFWLAETVCSDLQYPKRTVTAYKAWNGNRSFEVVA